MHAAFNVRTRRAPCTICASSTFTNARSQRLHTDRLRTDDMPSDEHMRASDMRAKADYLSLADVKSLCDVSADWQAQGWPCRMSASFLPDMHDASRSQGNPALYL